MKSNVKSFLVKIALAVLFVALIGMVISNVNFKKAQANEDPIFTVDGAWIKEVDDATLDDPTALRFTVTFNQAFVDTLNAGEGTATPSIIFYATIGGELIVEKDLLEIADLSDGTFEYNADFANFPVAAYQANLTIQVWANDVDGNEIDPAGCDKNGITRTMQYVAASATIDGAEGLEEYIGNGSVDTVYEDTRTSAQAVELDVVLADESVGRAAKLVEILVPGFDGSEANFNENFVAAYIDGAFDELGAIAYGEIDQDANDEDEVSLYGVYVDTTAITDLTKHEKHELVLITKSGIHKTYFAFTNFGISDYESLKTYFDYIGSNATNTGVYAMLTDNVDAGSNVVGVRTNGTNDAAALDKCAFDGQGYTISKLMVGRTSLFGLNFKNGLIENVGFVQMESNRIEDGSLLWWGGSNNTIRNVYIQGWKQTSKSSVAYPTNMAGITNDASQNYFYDCIFDIDFTGYSSTGTGNYADISLSGLGRYMIGRTSNHPNLVNVYGITATAKDLNTRQGYGTWKNAEMYHAEYDVYAAIHNNPEAKASFASYGTWNMENGAVVWATAGNNAKVVGATEYHKNVEEALTIDMAKYGIDSVASVTIEGTSAAFTAADGIITIDESLLPSALVMRHYSSTDKTHRANVIDVAITDNNGEEHIVQVNAVDYAISDLDSWKAWYTDMKTLVPDDDTAKETGNNKRATKALYAVLTNNIDLAAHGRHAAVARASGILNGRGYTVDNLLIQNYLFNNHGALLFENIAFTNASFNASSTAAATLASRALDPMILYNTYWEVDYSLAGVDVERGLDRSLSNVPNLITNTVFVQKLSDAQLAGKYDSAFFVTGKSWTPIFTNFTLITNATGELFVGTTQTVTKNNDNTYYGNCKYVVTYADVDAYFAGLDLSAGGTSADEHIDNWMKQSGLWTYDTTTTTSTDDASGETVTVVTHNSVKWATAADKEALKPSTVA